jgi:hypothetical protein
VISLSTKPQYCRECGRAIPAGEEKCSGCGHPVADASSLRKAVGTVKKPISTKAIMTSNPEASLAGSSQGIGTYQIADGFMLNTKTGDVWKYDENSNKLKVVEKEDSILTSVEKAKAYIGHAEEIDRWVGAWEDKLAEIGDDSQLANIDMQNMLQKQQQTIQIMSNISKVLHDTAMAVIRKIG